MGDQETETINIDGRKITMICNKFMPENTMFVSEDIFNDISGKTDKIQQEKIKHITKIINKYKAT